MLWGAVSVLPYYHYSLQQNNFSFAGGEKHGSSSSSPAEAVASTMKCDGRQKEFQRCESTYSSSCPTEDCVDCVFGEWSPWGKCECTGLQKRTREPTALANDCGAPCVGSQIETRACTPDCGDEPRDCEMGEWLDWESCPDPEEVCKSGILVQTSRSRQVKESAANGGRPCEGALKETKDCPVTYDCPLFSPSLEESVEIVSFGGASVFW